MPFSTAKVDFDELNIIFNGIKSISEIKIRLSVKFYKGFIETLTLQLVL